MAYRKRMLTREKLKRWGIIHDDQCVLCYAAVESQNHLFFDCIFSKCIWREVLRRNDINRDVKEWETESEWAVAETRGTDFKAKIRSLALAATVYMIWRERNYRIFRHMGKDWRVGLHQIEDLIKDATWRWRAKRSFANWAICKEWGLKDTIMLT